MQSSPQNILSTVDLIRPKTRIFRHYVVNGSAKFHVFQSSFSKEISFSLTANEPGILKNTNNGVLTWKKWLVLPIFRSSRRYTPYCFVFPLLITIAVHLIRNFVLPHYPRVGFVCPLQSRSQSPRCFVQPNGQRVSIPAADQKDRGLGERD